MKKILSLFIVGLLLVGCTVSDRNGLISWNNKLVESSNLMIELVGDKNKAQEIEVEFLRYQELLKTGDELELDKTDKEVHNQLKEVHQKSLKQLEIMNKSKYNKKEIDTYNKASEEYNNYSKEMDKLINKVSRK